MERTLLYEAVYTSNLIEAIMTKQPEEAKLRCTDLKYLSSHTKSNPVLMMEVIKLYLNQTPVLVKSMKNSFLDGDWDLLQSSVHKMIPSFNIMGISQDYENMARKVLNFATMHKQEEEIFELVLKIEQVCLQACMELQEELNRIKQSLK